MNEWGENEQIVLNQEMQLITVINISENKNTKMSVDIFRAVKSCFFTSVNLELNIKKCLTF